MKTKHFIVAVIIIIIDQLTKILAINNNVTIIPNILDFTYTENFGGAFGIGSRYIILFVSIIIIAVILIYLIKNRSQILNYIPYILIISGSIGNLIDRLFRGYVIDFIDINIFNFPNFNIADISIVIGVILLVIAIIRKK